MGAKIKKVRITSGLPQTGLPHIYVKKNQYFNKQGDAVPVKMLAGFIAHICSDFLPFPSLTFSFTSYFKLLYGLYRREAACVEFL